MSAAKTTLRTALLCVSMIVIPIAMMMFKLGVFGEPAYTQQKFTPVPWPPALNQPYPDLELIDQDGVTFHLSDLKGKVIVLEPTGMNCPACQAFSGAHDYGAYENNAVESHSKSFRKIFPHHAKGLRLPSRDVIFVQLLLYDMNMGAPTAQDAKKWAEHFKIYKKHNHYVAVSPYDLRSNASFNMIPGFQLIGKDFILRSDATGHNPKHHLYKTLIPHTVKLIKQKI